MAAYVGAVDQGTTSTRFMVFDARGAEVARHQVEHRQILARPGWVEHDPREIALRVDEVIVAPCSRAGLTGADLAAIGITNQRETTVVWNPKTGRPWYNAIVWQDTRSESIVQALAAADARCSASEPACRPPPTSPAPSSSGFSSTSTASATRPQRGRGAVRHDRHVGDLESDRRRATVARTSPT